MIPPITFPRAYARTGRHVKIIEPLKGSHFLSGERIKPGISPFWVLIAVNPDPKTPNRWLKLTAQHKKKATPTSEPVFVPFEEKAPGVLAAELTHESEVRLIFELLTDSEHYQHAITAEPRTIRRKLIVAAAAQVNNQRLEEQIAIELTVSDALKMPDYAGFVALDLGNTSSTLVRRSNALGVAADIHLVQTRENAAGPAEPATSALRIKTLKQAAPAHYATCDYSIGDEALAGNPPIDSLFLGAKRLLSDRGGEDRETIDFLLDGRPATLNRTEPAELYIAKMLQFFHRQDRACPSRIGLTCPTTFSRHEVEQLRIAAYHGGRRSRGENPRPTSMSPDDLRAYIPQVIDEASAAAFYFVHDEFLESAGRVAGFRYTYPQGMNLLLYDCGGGTTDIALVHVNVTNEVRGQYYVQFEVLGRAGHRNFGGDAMTMAVYRLLKIKLAAAFSVGSGEWPSAGEVKAFKSFLTNPEKIRQVDAKLPTAFHADEDDPTLPETRERKEATLRLWQVAERFKRRLADEASKSSKGQAEVKLTGSILLLEDLNGLLRRARLDENFENKDKVYQISLSTTEVDALLEYDARESVRYARGLIESRLPRDQEVHWVFVVGNASRYPLIRRTILDPEFGLPVRFLEERLRQVQPADLKNSVAKGALRVLQVAERPEDYYVEFDEKLMERLPFDIQRTGAGPLERVLFKENVLYEDLPPRDIVIEAPRQGQRAAREVVLKRVWPGDRRGEEYIRFFAPDPAKPFHGNYRIEYDRYNHRFKMRKLDDDNEPIGETFTGVTAVEFRTAPVQIGERAWPKVQA